MKFKRFFAVLSSAALSLSMLAAVNVSADDIDGADPSSRPYSFDYEITSDGAVVANVTVAEGIREVEIPDKTDSGITIVGVKDLAFEYADVETIVVPDTFKLNSIGTAAFLSAKDIENAIAGYGSSNEEALAFVANTVKFMGKNDWKGTEEELEGAKTVLGNIMDTAGLTGVANADGNGVTADKAAILAARLYAADVTNEKEMFVRKDGVDDITKMSEKSYSNFRAWVKTVPVNVTLKGTKGTAAEEYANGKAIVGVNFAEAVTHLKGDANQDGIVNVRDAAWIARALATNKVDEMITCKICADYNEDGNVNVRDAAAIARYLASKKD